MKTYWDLDFFHSGEWDVVKERLDECKGRLNPSRDQLFRSLDLCRERDCKVLVVGQDPYPGARFATGVAFSIPSDVGQKDFPPTLVNVLKEYASDLHLPFPHSGNLEAWCKQGVLLWNAIPSCEEGKSLSHNWLEWEYLTSEIVQRLSKQDCVLVFLGGVARKFVKYADGGKGVVLETSHPSPRGSERSRIPFIGSKIFTRINEALVSLGKEKVEWRLE